MKNKEMENDQLTILPKCRHRTNTRRTLSTNDLLYCIDRQEDNAKQDPQLCLGKVNVIG